MSYCRFSSDNWKSDVYVYEHVDGGWCIHTAGRKHTGEIPEFDLADALKNDPDWDDKYRVHMEAVQASPLEDINHPMAGQTFMLATAQECADKLMELRKEGFHVPDGVIEELEQEANGEAHEHH